MGATLGQERGIADELKYIADTLLRPHEKALAVERLSRPALPGRVDDGAVRTHAPARLVIAPAIREIAAQDLQQREIEGELGMTRIVAQPDLIGGFRFLVLAGLAQRLAEIGVGFLELGIER